MGMYLIKFGYTAETWRNLMASPEDPREALRPMLEAVGGKLHGLWYAFGDYDGFALIEGPDDVPAAGLSIKVAASGAFTSLSTTKLLTMEEALDALRQAGGTEYRAPGAASA